MSEKYALAPEFVSQPSITIPANGLLIRLLNFVIRRQRRSFDWSDEVEVRTHSVAGSDGNEISVFEIEPADLSGEAPALVDFHGGGFYLTYNGLHLAIAQRYAIEGRCRVFFPVYRLSVAHPFPAAFDDCYATLSWVHANAAELNVDPRRVALVGDSAGGALAAGVAQKALDRNENAICGQALIYPVTDHETKSESALRFDDTPLWKTASNRAMWKVYLRGETNAPAYAAPLHRNDFSGLPPAWVEVAEFDPLLDEGRQYARAVEAAGVPVELREVKGAVHAYDLIPRSPTAEAIFEERIAAIRRFFDRA